MAAASLLPLSQTSDLVYPLASCILFQRAIWKGKHVPPFHLHAGDYVLFRFCRSAEESAHASHAAGKTGIQGTTCPAIQHPASVRRDGECVPAANVRV